MKSIYDGLSKEDYERMLKQDIPEPIVVGTFELTEEKKREAEEAAKELAKRRRERLRKKAEEDSLCP